MFNPFSAAFPSGLAAESLNRISMACSQTLLDLTSSSSPSLGTERAALVHVQQHHLHQTTYLIIWEFNLRSFFLGR